MDERRNIGTIVHAKASQVLHSNVCNRRYGIYAKTTLLQGAVLGFEDVVNERSNRTSTTFEIQFDLGNGETKVVKLNSRSVILGPVPMDARIRNDDRIGMFTPTNNVEADAVVAAAVEAAAVELVDQHNNEADHVPPPQAFNEGEEQQLPQQPIAPEQQPIAPEQRRRQQRQNDDPLNRDGVQWYRNDHLAATTINGEVRNRSWAVRDMDGILIREGANRNLIYSRLDVFLMMFPLQQLNLIVRQTNELLRSKRLKPTTIGEVLKFFGIILLGTRYEFTTRASLWSNKRPSKYETAASFGKTGMIRKRFDFLWENMRFSIHPEKNPPGPDGNPSIPSETFRWQWVEGFVNNFNAHRIANFHPSERICVDESISRWYGQGGDWINHGLPMYVAMERKPENGCEIQTAACAGSGVMLQLKLVKSLREREREQERERQRMQEMGLHFDDDNLHGTEVLLGLVRPWMNTNRIVCADSYFASYGAAKALLAENTKFIGVVKTATRMFPMQALGSIQLPGDRGGYGGFLSNDPVTNVPSFLAFTWADRDRRNFIATTGSLLQGVDQTRRRWRQVDQSPNADPERVEIVVPLPDAAEIYYSTCAKIDQHNRDRQETLGMEKKFVTHEWWRRVNHSILAMIFVDTFKVYKQLTFHGVDPKNHEKQKDFYSFLAAELIDNKFDQRGMRARDDVMHAHDIAPRAINFDGTPRAGVDAHLTPNKERATRNGQLTANTLKRGRCVICGMKTRFLCSVCVIADTRSFCCYSTTGRFCFHEHLDRDHDNDNEDEDEEDDE